jgi:hypothetical protein
MAMSGTTPEPPPTSNAGVSPRHTNQPPMGPPHTEGIAGHHDVVEEARDFALLETFDCQFDLG